MMNGFLVVVRPYDDLKLLPDIWLVGGLPTAPRKKKFEAAFESALAKCKQRNPDEWTITDVLRELSKKWDISMQSYDVAVTY